MHQLNTMGFSLHCITGVSIAQSPLHAEGCQSGGGIKQAACKTVPALAESRFQTKKEHAHSEWAFKCLKDLCGANVFAAYPYMPG